MKAADRLREWSRALKREALVVWIVARDPRTPIGARLVAAAVAAYAFSPVDLIPDVISVLGLLDDLIVVPAGLALALRLVPVDVLNSAREEAAQCAEQPVSKAGLAVILALWALALILVARIALSFFSPEGLQ